MKNFNNAVAIITGAASGIGLALVEQSLKRGFNVVLADINEDALSSACDKLSDFDQQLLAVPTDVTSPEAIKTLFDRTLDKFGKVNLLVNNAGVCVTGTVWETSAETFQWIHDVNVNSCLYGINQAVPLMKQQGDDCHIVNVASGSGLLGSPGMSAYSMSKHAVVSLSECLMLDLLSEGINNIGVTLVMPGMIDTALMTSKQHAPTELSDNIKQLGQNAVAQQIESFLVEGTRTGLSAEQAANEIFTAIESNSLYVLPNIPEKSRNVYSKIAEGRCMGENRLALMSEF